MAKQATPPTSTPSTTQGQTPVAKQVKPVRQPPRVGGVKLPQADTDGAPKWALGLNTVITALISVMLVLGLEGIGNGISEMMQGTADVARVESLTTAQLLQAVQSSNVTLQNQLLEVENENRRLKEENQELRTILKYEVGIVVTPAVEGEPTLSLLPTPAAITFPTATPNAVEQFEEALTTPTVAPTVTPRVTATPMR